MQAFALMQKNQKIKTNPNAPAFCLAISPYNLTSFINCILRITRRCMINPRNLDLSDQGSTAEETTLQKLHQGEERNVLYIVSFLIFLLLFPSREKVKKHIL
jgi:hypothetical protein